MTSPHCPNCRAPMSSVERGLGGVWSCIYCEGTWLSPSQADAQSKHFERHPGVAPVGATPGSLLCPSCQSQAFETSPGGIDGAHRCTACSSLFLEKGVLAALAPQAFSVHGEAPTPEALVGLFGSALTLDPLPLFLALQAKREKNPEL